MGDDEFEKAKQLQGATNRVIAKIRDNGAEFLLEELTTGLTFVQLAHDSQRRGQSEAALRQKEAAIKAYQTALKFLPETTPTPPQMSAIEDNLAKLESQLKALDVD